MFINTVERWRRRKVKVKQREGKEDQTKPRGRIKGLADQGQWASDRGNIKC